MRAPRCLALLPVTVALAGVAALLIFVALARAAAPDDNVEWFGISHVPWQDRRPVCPVAGQSFQVRVQAFRNDLTALRVHLVAPAASSIDAAVVAHRGPYDIWAAQIPATGATIESYVIELVDGTDTDWFSTAGVTDDAPAAGTEFALNFTTLEHAPLGATLVTGGTVFRVWAPGATTCAVRGEFNAWGLANPMTKTGEYFTAFVAGASDRQMYKYFFNNNASSGWKPDARGRSLDAANGPYNTHIENPFRYAWGDSNFTTPPLEQMVIYQLHVGTFAGGLGDPVGATPFPARYVDVAARVGHLVDLGVNAVQLNPITEFPGDLSAGYNPITQWAPEWKYGTPDELRNLIDVLHRHGIAVLLDIVWNHFDNTDNFMWNYDGTQTYFDTPQVETPWGSQADFDKLAVRDYYVHSALQWLEEYHVDGFRMDATSYMNIAPQAAAGWSLMKRFNDEIDGRYANAVTIAEQLPDDAHYTLPTSLGGAGFDSQYHDAFVDNVRQEIFDAASGDPEMWRINDLVYGGGPYLENHAVLNYVELHDEAWPTSGGQRMVKTIDTVAPHDDAFAKGRTKLAEGLVLTVPGVPAFLMGTEWLEDTDFGTASANRIDWSKKTTYAPIFAYYKKLVGLRRSSPALWADAPKQVIVVDEAANLIAFRRYSGTKQTVVIANFSNSDRIGYRIGLPLAGNWEEAINSQSLAYDGNGVGNPGVFAAQPIAAHGFAQSAALNIPRMGLLILAPAGIPLGVDGPATASVGRARIERVSPNPFRGPGRISLTLPHGGNARVSVLDVSGREVAVLADRWFEAGAHEVRWSGTGPHGEREPAGIYFVRLRTADGSDARRVVVL